MTTLLNLIKIEKTTFNNGDTLFVKYPQIFTQQEISNLICMLKAYRENMKRNYDIQIEILLLPEVIKTKILSSKPKAKRIKKVEKIKKHRIILVGEENDG